MVDERMSPWFSWARTGAPRNCLITKETPVVGTDFHRLTNKALLLVLLCRTWKIRAQALQGQGTQQLMLVNRFSTLPFCTHTTHHITISHFFSKKAQARILNTDSYNHRILASQSPRLLLSALTLQPFSFTSLDSALPGILQSFPSSTNCTSPLPALGQEAKQLGTASR